jgi:hypothetical protein
MAVFIVTYDLNAPGKDYAPLLAAIRRYTPHCYALKSAFFIDSAETAQRICAYLSQFIDANDALYVMELRRHFQANRMMPCVTWLLDTARSWNP